MITSWATIALVLYATSLGSAQQAPGNCIPLANSRLCPAFSEFSVSAKSSNSFPFLAFVSNTTQFDTKFEAYIRDEYSQSKYQNILGCNNINLSNTSNLYARFTTSVLCNAMVQSSAKECNSERSSAAPLCADTCAQFAISEQIIASDSVTCNSTRNDRTDQIRSDFTICALPANSLSGDCISGSDNESNNCGFGTNLPGLCLYCAKSSPNSTDPCCFNSNVDRCNGVRLPPTSALPPLFTDNATNPSNSSGAGIGNSHKSLSGGAIAGITIGSIAALALAILLAIFLLRRRKQGSTHVFNQPSPRRSTSQNRMAMAFNPVRSTSNGVHHQRDGYEALPSSRIARMSALETTNNNNNTSSETGASPQSQMEHTGRGAVVFPSSSSTNPHSGDTSESNNKIGYPHTGDGRPLQPPPRAARNTSLSSGSALDNFPSSPTSEPGNEMSSPMYESSQSEQLNAFKDYYSRDDIHPNDKVTVLWAYSPRAADEFELERGDVVKIVGIWDDGWATGIRLNERAEDIIKEAANPRDSGVSASQGSRLSRDKKDMGGGDIKAFPLVCVCLPEHWQKIIDQENRTSQIVTMNIHSAYDKPPESELQSFTPDTGLGQGLERSGNQKGSGRFPNESNSEKRH